MICAWFLRCERPATHQVEHPTIGWVDICEDCLAWLGDSPSPTQYVPPIVAASASRLAQH
jgi:hypothetical protein